MTNEPQRTSAGRLTQLVSGNIQNFRHTLESHAPSVTSLDGINGSSNQMSLRKYATRRAVGNSG